MRRKEKPNPRIYVDSNQDGSLSSPKQSSDHPLKGGIIVGGKCKFLLMTVRHLAAAIANSDLKLMLLGLSIASIPVTMTIPFIYPLWHH